MIGALSPRMLFLLCSVLFALVPLVKNIKKQISNIFNISVLLFVFYIFICAFRGHSLGNDTSLIVSDLKGFAYLSAVIVSVLTVNSKQRISFLLKTVCLGALLQAIISLLIYIAVCFAPILRMPLYYYMFNALLATHDFITPVIYRMFFKSSPYMIVACVFFMYLQIKNEKFSLKYSIATAVLMWSVILTFTRSVYGALGLTALNMIILYVVIERNSFKKILKHIIISLLLMVFCVGIQSMVFSVNYFEFAFERTFGISGEMQSIDDVTDDDSITEYFEDTEDSDAFRQSMIKEVSDSIESSPIFGNGLGAAITYSTNGMIEYFYYDIINKTGFVGLLLYCFPMITSVLTLIKQFKKKTQFAKSELYLSVAAISAVFAFFVVTWFNPYMNSSIGISCYATVLGIISCVNKDYLFLHQAK